MNYCPIDLQVDLLSGDKKFFVTTRFFILIFFNAPLQKKNLLSYPKVEGN